MQAQVLQHKFVAALMQACVQNNIAYLHKQSNVYLNVHITQNAKHLNTVCVKKCNTATQQFAVAALAHKVAKQLNTQVYSVRAKATTLNFTVVNFAATKQTVLHTVSNTAQHTVKQVKHLMQTALQAAKLARNTNTYNATANVQTAYKQFSVAHCANMQQQVLKVLYNVVLQHKLAVKITQHTNYFNVQLLQRTL